MATRIRGRNKEANDLDVCLEFNFYFHYPTQYDIISLLVKSTLSYLVILLAKVKLSITVEEDLIKWLDSQIKKRRFANRSHGFEYALTQVKENT